MGHSGGTRFLLLLLSLGLFLCLSLRPLNRLLIDLFTDEPDIIATTAEYARLRGFEIEEHEITTSDEYILECSVFWVGMAVGRMSWVSDPLCCSCMGVSATLQYGWLTWKIRVSASSSAMLAWMFGWVTFVVRSIADATSSIHPTKAASGGFPSKKWLWSTCQRPWTTS